MTDTPQSAVPSQEAAMSSDIVERLRAVLRNLPDSFRRSPPCEEREAILAAIDHITALKARDTGWSMQCEEQQETIAALEAKLAGARAEAIEECAKVVLNPPPSGLRPREIESPCRFQRRVIAQALRSLADHTPDKEDDDAKG